MRRIIIAHRLRDLIHLPVRIPDQFDRFLNPVILKVFSIRKSHLIFKKSRRIDLFKNILKLVAEACLKDPVLCSPQQSLVL